MESENIEYKSSLKELKEIMKTICALSNTKGGTIFVGVDDSGKKIGVKIGKNTIENLSNTIRRDITPTPEIEIKHEGKILRIDVKEHKFKPTFYKGVAYKRVGNTNQKMTPTEIRTAFMNPTPFEDRVSDKTYEFVDEYTLEEFIKRAYELKRIPTKEQKKNILEKLDLVENGKLKNSALLFFGKDPSIVYPICAIKFAAVSSEQFDTENILELQEISGPVQKMIEKTVELIEKHLPKKYEIKGIIREEKPILDISVARELVTNAVIHRDYDFPSYVYVLITPNKLEISNPGPLIGLKIEDLYRVHRSVLRNPKLANLAYLSGLVEKWGQGTLKVVRTVAKNIGTVPEFKSNSHFTATIYFKPKNEYSKIIHELAKEKMEFKELMSKLDVSERTLRRRIKELMNYGIIAKKKEGRRTLYVLV